MRIFHKIKFQLFALVTGMLILTSCDKEDNLIPDSINSPSELTAVLTQIYESTQVAGFTVAVAQNNEILYQNSFGMADIENQRPYTNQTTQPIGSISKTFVAAALVKAIEQGYLSLETDINDILPFEVTNPKKPSSSIKIKHLVTHTSGLLDNLETYISAYYLLPNQNLNTQGARIMQEGFGLIEREAVPLGDLMYSYYNANGSNYSTTNYANAEPGNSWNYSNLATSLTAYIIELATQTPFNEYVATQILAPLEMNNTAYNWSELPGENVAKLYWEKGDAFPLYRNDSYPDGSINTCNNDLAKYLLNMMQGARGESTTLFSKEGYQMLFTPLLDEDIALAQEESQAIFWFIQNNQIMHDGSDPGTTCNLQFDTNGNSGYLLMTNMDASTDEHTIAYFDLAKKVDDAIKKYTHNN